jgi:hypothetical protein
MQLDRKMEKYRMERKLKETNTVKFATNTATDFRSLELILTYRP